MAGESEAQERGNEPDGDSRSIWIPECRSTALYLEDLQRKIMAEFLTEDFRNSPILRKHLDKNYMILHTSVAESPLPFGSNREEVFDNMEMAIKQDKALAWTIDHVVVNVHRGTRTAEVWFVVQASNTEYDKVFYREGLGISFFERRLEDGIWMAYRYVIMIVRKNDEH